MEIILAEKQQALLALRLMLAVAEREWSVRQLAEHAHLPLLSVQRICSGNGKQPSVWTLVQLAQTLDLSLDYLVGLRETPLVLSAREEASWPSPS